MKKILLMSCQKKEPSQLLKDESGNLLFFTKPDSVIFVVCKNCESIFEANNKIANNLISAAKTFAELEKDDSEKDFPEELLNEKGIHRSHYLELSSCRKCDDSHTIWVWAKKILSKN